MIVGCGDLTILLVGLGFHCFLLKCKEKLRHSLGRPSRSDFVQLEVDYQLIIKNIISKIANPPKEIVNDLNALRDLLLEYVLLKQ